MLDRADSGAQGAHDRPADPPASGVSRGPSSVTASAATSNARTISRNSFWYVLDASAATIVMLIASVPVARVMGPQVLGNYIYLVFITNIAQRLANVGIPATACKYIAEFLGAGQPGIAHQVYRTTFKHQVTIATVVTTIGLALVMLLSQPAERVVSLLIVLSMWPSMVNNIPAQANVAAENLRANIPASFASFITYVALVTGTLVFGWGLMGLATATFVSRTVEALVRYLGVRHRLRGTPRVPLPADLSARMFTFSKQNLVLLGLGLIVWDRSELLLLKHFSDVTQVAFYSLAFSISNQLLMAPRAFSTSIGYTIFAQYGRDWRRLESLMQNATRYVALIAFPMFLGMAAITEPLIRLVYGQRYLAVIPVLWVLSIFAIPRSFQSHSESLLQATETQGFMVRWLAVSAVVNLSLDFLLIPRYGALGAGIANGLAQTFAVGGVWVKATSVLQMRLPWRFLRGIIVSALAMLAVVVMLGRAMPALPGLVVGVLGGVLVFAVCVRLTKCLEFEDWQRFNELSARLPKPLRSPFATALEFLVAGVPERLAEPAEIS